MSSYKLSITQKPRYLHAVVTGLNRKENVTGYLEEIRRECASRGCPRVLIEERLEGPRLNTTDVFQIAAEGSRRGQGLELIAYEGQAVLHGVVLGNLLFVLLGLEVLVIPFGSGSYLVAGLLAIPIVLIARFVATGVPIRLIRRLAELTPHSVKLLTWSGLRGGISVALALSLRGHLPAEQADVLLVMTYVVVVFSVLVQGLTIKPVLRRYLTAQPPADSIGPWGTEAPGRR